MTGIIVTRGLVMVLTEQILHTRPLLSDRASDSAHCPKNNPVRRAEHVCTVGNSDTYMCSKQVCWFIGWNPGPQVMIVSLRLHAIKCNSDLVVRSAES